MSANVKSSCPEFAYSKVMEVPLFAGFMYAAVGSFIIQVWRALDLRVVASSAVLDDRHRRGGTL